MGMPAGVLIGLAAGGWINEVFDWRTAFFVVGVPGLALAFLVRLTIREPPGDTSRIAGGASVRTRDVFPLPQKSE